MSNLKLSCPHCGYSKEVQRDLIPHEEVRLKCPKCAESFVFNVKAAEQAAEAEAAAEAAAAAPVEAPAPAAAGGEEKVRAVCPACGFFRKISADLIPPEGKRMKCPRCKEAFTVGGPEAEPEEAPTVAGGVERVEEPPSMAPVEEQAVPPEMPETEYGGYGIGELSGHLGEPIAGEAEEEPLYAAEPEPEEGLPEGEAVSPEEEETFPPEPEFPSGYEEAGIGELSGHFDTPILQDAQEEEHAQKYHPARNIPQAETAKPAGGGYQVSMPEDLLEAAEASPTDEIEVIPAGEEETAPAEEEEKPAAAYQEGRSERPRARKDHGFAVKTDFDEFLKEPAPRPVEEEYEGPEVVRLGPGTEEGERRDLVSVGDLFRQSWALLKSKAGTFIPLVLICPVFILSAMGISYGIAYLFSTMIPDKAFAIQTTGMAFGIFTSAYFVSWWAAAFIKAVSDETIMASESFSLTKPIAGAFMWLFVISALIIAGGYMLFVVPGLLMSVWFAFSFYVLVDEDERGLAAMIKSREYVRGYWPGVFLRLFIVWFPATALAAVVKVLGILYMFYLPFPVAYTYLLYLDLKDIKGPIRVRPTTASKTKFVAIGLLGLVTPFALVAGLFYSGALGRLDKTYGLDTRTLLAELTGEDDAVKGRYEDYRKALLAGDYKTMTGYLTADYLAKLGSRSTNIIDYKKALSPSKPVNIVSVEFDNLSARLSLECPQEGGVMIGNATMVKRLGKWYIAGEDWSLNVRPRPITLRGGVPAPEFTPIDVGFITPGPDFGSRGSVKFYDPSRKLKPLVTLAGHEGSVNKVRFLPGGTRLVSTSDGDRTVRLWDVVTGAQLAMRAVPYAPVGMDVAPDGSLVVLTDSYNNLVFIPLSEDKFGDPELLSSGTGAESRLAVSPNGLLLATASTDKLVTIWDLAARKELVRINTPEPMRGLTFSPAGDLLAVCSSTNKFTLFSLEGGDGRTYTIPGVDKMSDVSSIDISPDGRYLITGHMDSSITVWELSDQKIVFNYFVKNAATWDVAFCPDSGCYATAQQNSKIYVWETVTAGKLATLEGHGGIPTTLSFSSDGRFLASGGTDNKIIIWGTAKSAVKAKVTDAEGFAAAVSRPIKTTGRASSTLGIDKTEFKPGEDILVSYSAGDDFKDDAWVGIVPSGVPHGDEAENDEYDIVSMLLEGSLSGTVKLKAPDNPGEYDVRMFTSDTGGVEAAHLSFVVK